MRKIGVIGVGNMGSALIKGMIKRKIVAPSDVTAYDTDTDRLAAFCVDTGAVAAEGNAELARFADTVLLAVKPDKAADVLAGIRGALTREKLLVSIVLGLTLDRLAEYGGDAAGYVRCMPNTPALVNEGMICIAMGAGTDAADRDYVASLFNAVGMTEFMSETTLSKVTALTGSSPAYIFVMLEAMADAAVLNGIPRAIAYRLASQAVSGSAKMALESGRHPGELKDMVCSPAGSTIDAIRQLEERGFRGAVIDAMRACDIRSDEISRGC